MSDTLYPCVIDNDKFYDKTPYLCTRNKQVSKKQHIATKLQFISDAFVLFLLIQVIVSSVKQTSVVKGSTIWAWNNESEKKMCEVMLEIRAQKMIKYP